MQNFKSEIFDQNDIFTVCRNIIFLFKIIQIFQMHAIAEFTDIKDGKLVPKNSVNVTSEITLSIYRQPKIHCISLFYIQ